MADVNVPLRAAIDRLTQQTYRPLVLEALHDYAPLDTLILTQRVEKVLGRRLVRPLDPLLWRMAREGVIIRKVNGEGRAEYRLSSSPVNRRIKLLLDD